jgi:hypothetical protein
MTLTIESQSAGISIVGSDGDRIRISCTLESPERAKDVHIRFVRPGNSGELKVSGGLTNNTQIRIEVPWQTSFRLSMPAGEVRVTHVSGNKDIALRAGQVVISGVNDSEYRTIDAGVDVGDVRAAHFGVDKGGFFRSYRRNSADGTYGLRVRLLAGQIELK